MMQFYNLCGLGSFSLYAVLNKRAKSSILLVCLALLSAVPVFAAVDFNVPIQGRVLGENGEALLGATILEKGTTNGTVTDFEGNFQLEVNENAILVVSYTGFTTQEVTVTGAMSSLQITLSPSVEALEEVIVTGYGTTKRTNLTNAVSKINSESLQDRPITSLGEAFSGQLAGVYAQQSSGLPGAEFAITIRGSNSITSGSEPLYVVDGMPVQSMKDINIGDVQSIDVLKDASAAAIYGARGAGGVVLITTRSAKEGQTQINLDVTTGVRQVPKSNKLDMLNGPQYREWREWIRNESYLLDGRDPAVPVADRPARFRGPDFWYTNPEYITDTDWQDAITRNALRQNYQVSVLKGTEGGSFMISGNYTNDQGVVVNSGYERFSFRANGQYRINDKFTAGLNLSSTFSEQSGWREAERKEGAWMRAIVANPTVPVGLNHRSGPLGLVEADPDPVLQMKSIKDIGNTARTIGTVYLGFEPIAGLNFRGQFGLDNQDWRYDYFKPQDVNKKTRREALDRTSRDTRFLTQFTATYDRDFGKHGLSLLGGTSFEKTAYEFTNLDSWDFGSDDIQTFNAAASFRGWDDFERESALASVFGRVQYNFASKYLLSGSIRYDGSSKFGADNRYGIFPAASFGWRLSEEGFLKGDPTISQLKLRASWGQSGNDRIGAY
ncbi:MAG: SusC/RagA family TonB-linked outer membrane protein, partial [Saprospiraceae bacterium]|nr:SusC/RagA family TonB-linked outer membrane protein [Saprospiraceae bacterium]